MDNLTFEQTKGMLLAAADRIIASKDILTEVDSKIGDGDHGIGMHNGMVKARQALEQAPDNGNVFSLFSAMGMAMMMSMGGASGGDDALAMSIEKLTGIGIQWIYLIDDLIILALSLSYIPFRRIAYSLLTVVLSGQLIGLVAKKKPSATEAAAEPE